jgi:hypothetical protein
MSKHDFRVDGPEIRRYFTTLSDYLAQTLVTSDSGQTLEMSEAINQIMALCRRTHASGNKVILSATVAVPRLRATWRPIIPKTATSVR